MECSIRLSRPFSSLSRRELSGLSLTLVGCSSLPVLPQRGLHYATPIETDGRISTFTEQSLGLISVFTKLFYEITNNSLSEQTCQHADQRIAASNPGNRRTNKQVLFSWAGCLRSTHPGRPTRETFEHIGCWRVLSIISRDSTNCWIWAAASRIMSHFCYAARPHRVGHSALMAAVCLSVPCLTLSR